jgi:CRISPR-associated protein Cmr5
MSTKSLPKTLEQQRATRAWECVGEVTSKSQDFKKKYGSLARKVPTLILTNGLGQTLAFLKAKGKNDPADEHTVLFRHLSRWVLSQVAPSSPATNGDLLQWVLQNDSASYRRATVEALAFLTWLKRFAEAELPAEEE